MCIGNKVNTVFVNDNIDNGLGASPMTEFGIEF